MIRFRAILLAFTLALAVLSASNQTFAQEARWEPPEPDPVSKDWLRLGSGEWLRGEIHLLNDDKLEFESEDLDDLELDWDDVAALLSPRILTYTFSGGETFAGTATMRNGAFLIRSEQETREFARSNLLSIIEGEPTEWNFWSAKVSVGIIGRSGNTDQEDLNSIVLLRRQATRSRFDIEYKGNFARTNDVKTVSNHRATTKLDILVSKGFFVTPVWGGIYVDKFTNIDLRATIGAGAGYFLVRKSGLDWYVQLGGGYQSTKFGSVEPGESDKEESAAISPKTALEMEITGSLDLTLEYTSQVTIPDPKGTIHYGFGMLSYEFTSLLDFDISLTWDRVENPRADAEGNVSVRDDFRLYFGLGLDI
jgi:putative salt-induced outer membrane protein YdiY